MNNQKDLQVLRELAKEYMEIANLPIQAERRKLWSAHNSLKPTRTLILASFGMWNVWCREIFADDKMLCEDSLYREYELKMRMDIFRHKLVDDDYVLDPWISVGSVFEGDIRNLWGLKVEYHRLSSVGSSYIWDAPIKTWDDLEKIKPITQQINVEKSKELQDKIEDAIGDIVPINRIIGCTFTHFNGDISTEIVRLRGLEQLMIDMYESPKELHRLLAIMRDTILDAQETAEKMGHLTTGDDGFQYIPYFEKLEWPSPNSGSRKRKELPYFAAAQEYTGISPEMHDEFLLQYQLPIIEKWGLSAYGCCEDLTRKIDMLRKIPNLRQIAVTPSADVAKCAEQIGKDYVISWRPNPTDMICGNFNQAKICSIVDENLQKLKETYFHIHLKDIETVEGDINRLKEWVKMVREQTERQ